MRENMKKHFTAFVLTAVFLTAIPLFTVKTGVPKATNKKILHQKDSALTDMLAYIFDEDFCTEGLKAAAIILNSNYKAGAKVNTINKNDFLKKYKNGKDYYSELEKLSDTIKDLSITYNGKAVKTPCYYITNGICEGGKPYLRNTANPWDYFCPEYTFDAKAGVSLYSVNKMCEKGLSAEEVLNRYFKDVKIA